MPMFALPVKADNTVVLKKPSKISICTDVSTKAKKDAVLAIWRKPVEAHTAPNSRNLGMTSGATTTTYGYESSDPVVLNEKTITALGARTAVTTTALANPTPDNEKLVFNLSDVATNDASQHKRQILSDSGSLPVIAVCRDYITVTEDGKRLWTRAIWIEANTGTDEAARVEGIETNVTTLPLSIKAVQAEGYDLVEFIYWLEDGESGTSSTDSGGSTGSGSGSGSGTP